MEVYAIEPLDTGLPGVRSLTLVRKSSSAAARPDEDTISYYPSSRAPGPAQTFAQHIRGHWGGCEIRNRWVRDALWSEDKTRSRNWNLNANLAILRAGLIALRAETLPDKSWPEIFEDSAFKPSLSLKLVTRRTAK